MLYMALMVFALYTLFHAWSILYIFLLKMRVPSFSNPMQDI